MFLISSACLQCKFRKKQKRVRDRIWSPHDFRYRLREFPTNQQKRHEKILIQRKFCDRVFSLTIRRQSVFVNFMNFNGTFSHFFPQWQIPSSHNAVPTFYTFFMSKRQMFDCDKTCGIKMSEKPNCLTTANEKRVFSTL